MAGIRPANAPSRMAEAMVEEMVLARVYKNEGWSAGHGPEADAFASSKR